VKDKEREREGKRQHQKKKKRESEWEMELNMAKAVKMSRVRERVGIIESTVSEENKGRVVVKGRTNARGRVRTR
jgi:hypothetical protein